MELYNAMRTTFAAREFTNEPVTDSTLNKILDNARFAPSGGNRQGWRVIIIRDSKTRAALAEFAKPAAKRYAAQRKVGENPWNTIDPTSLSDEAIEQTPVPPHMAKTYTDAPVVLIVCVDLKVVAAMDQYLKRVGVISGASIYPFVWNILLAAHEEGLAGTITTMPVAEEPKVQEFLGIPKHFAVCAVIPLGKPIKNLTQLTRNPVSSFATLEHWDGTPLTDE